MLRFTLTLGMLSVAFAFFDDLHLPDNPLYYNEYSRQCRVPVKCASDSRCPEVYDWKDLERWAQREAYTRFEWESSFTDQPCSLISKSEYDYNLFSTGGLTTDEEIGVKNTMTTDILLEYLSEKAKCPVRNLLEGRCPSVNQSLSLEKCQHKPLYKCDPTYPYRSYNGICNNLRHATWGQAGNPLKLEIAPCFDDFVSKQRRSSTGKTLPNNREVVSDIQRALSKLVTEKSSAEHMFSIFGLMFAEFVTSDMIGRVMKRARNATGGFRGCLADGKGPSPYKAPLTAPLKVLPNDINYGPKDVECLNFSPIENANDQCDLRYPTKRNTATSYLDLSGMYADGQQYDENGKLKTSYCGASNTFDRNHVISIQFMAIAGLFAKLHNYCIDRVRSCGQHRSTEEITEKCRALTTGVYQRIVYDEWLYNLFGDDLFQQCNFTCEYDETLESTVSSTYTNAPGRFQHVWIPDHFTVVQDGQHIQKPVFEFFHNFHSFNCPSVIEGMFNDSIRVDTLSETLINTFFTDDGVHGHCLLCLDLERGRDAGLCPLVLYKHYFDRISENPTKCYNSFDDLNDIFYKELIDVFKKHYESPFDIDALFLIFENEIPDGSFMPRTVAASTCVQFKNLMCSDRFFYSWNQFMSPAMKELINSIDMVTLLGLFGEIQRLPRNPWFVNSETFSADEVFQEMESKHHLFCGL
nr:peroxidase skpo-1 [Aedes albopictus]